jgi:hypothetical protein
MHTTSFKDGMLDYGHIAELAIWLGNVDGEADNMLTLSIEGLSRLEREWELDNETPPLYNSNIALGETVKTVRDLQYKWADLNDDDIAQRKHYCFHMNVTVSNDVRDLNLPLEITQTLLDAGICNTLLLRRMLKFVDAHWQVILPSLSLYAITQIRDSVDGYYNP